MGSSPESQAFDTAASKMASKTGGGDVGGRGATEERWEVRMVGIRAKGRLAAEPEAAQRTLWAAPGDTSNHVCRTLVRRGANGDVAVSH